MSSPVRPIAGTRPAKRQTGPLEGSIHLRVRYTEVDAMGYLHHSRFLQYFEMGRIELLRVGGVRYADLERRGVFFVVVRAEVAFKRPARYDEEITLTTREVRRTHVKIEHEYEVRREGTLLATGRTAIACVGRDGRPMAIPGSI
jgi:acyl-CoA thioester hydrolase